uniref:EF-hand domain-containing protein n=2 Tax=Chlamydomonas euryale TaxID=1486919 RepID=A0A7R9Z366_9CHLO|mmetsp:Transcript_40873/g.122022  ORF Transcript_40873/g.122022 Transcript_40873/m.122022 type:complete len:140 (+) Transcript_40873:321-740(+)
MLACADINADGVIDYQEFLAATVHEQRLDKDELLFKAFQEFDTDGSGFIGREEMATAFAKHGGPKVNIDALLKEIDTDCDGRINYDEFCTCFRRHDDAASGLAGLLPTPGMPQAAALGAGAEDRIRTPAADAGHATGIP